MPDSDWGGATPHGISTKKVDPELEFILLEEQARDMNSRINVEEQNHQHLIRTMRQDRDEVERQIEEHRILINTAKKYGYKFAT